MPQIIAHRGASADAPENTLPAVELAWQQGADAVEIDVHITRDDQVVVIHDPTTIQTAGANLTVAQASLAELRTLDVGSWKGPSWTGTTIPTLAETVATIPQGKRLVVELKFPTDRAQPFVQLCQSFPPEQLLLIAFSMETLHLMRAGLPDCETGWIIDFTSKPGSNQWTPALENLIEQANSAELHSLDLDGTGPIDSDQIRQIHDAGLQCYVWTVDSVTRARELARAGVDGITTNTPARMIKALRS